MKKLIGCLCITFFLLLVSVSVCVNAQITKEKDIPKGYIPIYSIEDLYGINDDMDANYILMADIDMSETAEGGDWDFGYGWRPIGYSSETSSYWGCDYFRGIIDGNGHRISNLSFCNDAPYYFLGLIAYNTGEIKNLAIDDICIDCTSKAQFNYCGSIAGVSYGHIHHCYVTGTINIEKIVEDSDWDDWDDDERPMNGNIGGIAGGTYGVNDCYTNIDINADSAGGILGVIDSAGWEKARCYVLGKTTGIDCGMIASEGERFTNSCYYLKTNGTSKDCTGLSKAQMKLQKCYTGFDFDEDWFIDKNSSYPYPQLYSCPQVRTESVEITSVPAKTKYDLKDKIDFSGAELTVNYEDDYSVKIPITESMCKYSTAKKGKQTVTVSYNGCQDEFEISVGEGKDVLTVTAEVSKLEVGDSFKFKAKYTGEEKIVFKSSNKKILSINKKTGKAKAKKAGTVTITISAGSLKEEIKVKVTK